jgi:hypothetical protein
VVLVFGVEKRKGGKFRERWVVIYVDRTTHPWSTRFFKSHHTLTHTSAVDHSPVTDPLIIHPETPRKRRGTQRTPGKGGVLSIADLSIAKKLI